MNIEQLYINIEGVIVGGVLDGDYIYISPSDSQENIFFIFTGEYDCNGNIPFIGDDICEGLEAVISWLSRKNIISIKWKLANNE